MHQQLSHLGIKTLIVTPTCAACNDLVYFSAGGRFFPIKCVRGVTKQLRISTFCIVQITSAKQCGQGIG